MATYQELFDLQSNNALRNKVAVAGLVAAEAIRGEGPEAPNHANRMAWAARVLRNPSGEAPMMLAAVLAANKTATVEQIENATDAQIQEKVAAAVDLFATGE